MFEGMSMRCDCEEEWFDIRCFVPPIGKEVIVQMDVKGVERYTRLRIKKGQSFDHIKKWKDVDKDSF